MPDMNMTQNNEAPQAPEAPMDDSQDSGTPIDSVISTVDTFLSDPKSITPDSLKQLRMDLEDLKTVLDGEESPEQHAPQQSPSAGGLAGMIGG